MLPDTVSTTTTSSRTASPRWLLEATCHAAPADGPAWHAQLELLRSVGFFDPGRDVWLVRIGALNCGALTALNTLYEAASRYRTQISFTSVAAPPGWKGPTFEGDGELAQLVAAAADRGPGPVAGLLIRDPDQRSAGEPPECAPPLAGQAKGEVTAIYEQRFAWALTQQSGIAGRAARSDSRSARTAAALSSSARWHRRTMPRHGPPFELCPSRDLCPAN